MAEQTFANHRKFFPLFHFLVMPIMLANLIWSINNWRNAGFAMSGIIPVVVAVGLVCGFLAARLMALAVQDRVIRLEERIRYERLLPADLKARAGELTLGQIVSLRFASDDELPVLARKVLDEKMDDRSAIKQLVKNWRPDHLRA